MPSYNRDYDRYYESVLADAKEYIEENGEFFNDFEDLYDRMFIEVTGNDNGSYFCNAMKAEEFMGTALFDEDIIKGLIFDFGYNDAALGELLMEGAETVDVVIRCWMLGEVRPELEKEFYEVCDC